MKKSALKWIILSLCILLGAAIAFGVFLGCLQWRNAKKAAEAYVSKKYGQEFLVERMRYSWIDPALFHVYFKTTGQESISFEVLVNADLTISSRARTYSADNYDIKCFEAFASSTLQEIANSIFDEAVVVRVIYDHEQPLYSFYFPLSCKGDETLYLQNLHHWITDCKVYLYYAGNAQPQEEQFMVALQVRGLAPKECIFQCENANL